MGDYNPFFSLEWCVQWCLQKLFDAFHWPFAGPSLQIPERCDLALTTPLARTAVFGFLRLPDPNCCFLHAGATLTLLDP